MWGYTYGVDTEETSQPKSKKFLKVALGVLVVFLLLAGMAFFLTALKNAKQEEEQILNITAQTPREPTEAEKLAIAQNEELDRIRTQYQTQSSSSATTTLKYQTKSLDTLLRSQTLKQETTTAVTPITPTQQSLELDALRSAILNK